MDKQTLIDNLNGDLANELSAIIQYTTYAAKATGPYRPQLASFFLAEVTERIIEKMPEQLSFRADRLRSQNARVTNIIATFGRHPHRNAILSRLSTPQEEAYIEAGDFPHLRAQKL